ncbi:hypothetical protein PILCRDRAFT_814597 [Piloderma croceum F 1598]|uniref:Hydrophobin n=1 Tax=Piloderma croceum (strain F 1598) TaxID=765440 RepID=A0A0C3GB96_PILCF|nr:hypothetical protein PILCRDRAFT_814597 [Piloderma croceum F 1598]
MRLLESTALFAFAFAMFASASLQHRDDICTPAGFPCQNIISGLLPCCNGLGCKSILDLVGFCEQGT